MLIIVALFAFALFYKNNEFYDYPPPKFSIACKQAIYKSVNEIPNENEFSRALMACIGENAKIGETPDRLMRLGFGCYDIKNSTLTCSTLAYKVEEYRFGQYAFKLTGNPVTAIQTKKETGFAFFRNCEEKCAGSAYCKCIGNEHRDISL